MRSRRGTSASNRRRPAAGNSWPGRGSGRRASGKLGLLDADDYGARPVVASLVAGRVDDLRLSQGETARIVRPLDRRRFAGIVAEDGLAPRQRLRRHVSVALPIRKRIGCSVTAGTLVTSGAVPETSDASGGSHE